MKKHGAETRVEDATAVLQNISATPEFLHELIAYACDKNVSDVHIDPEDAHTSIRIRIEGQICLYKKIAKRFHEELIGRIKVLSKLRTDVHDKGQDGRFSFTYVHAQDKTDDSSLEAEKSKTEKIDMRVSILPTFYGENAVLRLLRPEHGSAKKFSDLGMFDDQVEAVQKELKRSQGMIIVAGPTGCGKTTTIYTMILALLDASRNVVTVEDPIEYLIAGVRQIQVSDHADFSFAQALRSILRQDPDVIVIGEMRDGETATLAFQASLTGHLVITSLHAEDSAGVCARLRDLGISNQLLHSLSLIVSQRIVNLPTQDVPTDATTDMSTRVESAKNGDIVKNISTRTGIFEILQVKGNIKLALFQNSFPEYIRLTLHRHGVLLLRDSAYKKCKQYGASFSPDSIIADIPAYE